MTAPTPPRDFVERAMSLVDDVAEARNDADFDKFSDKKSSLRAHLQQREAQAAKLAEALKDLFGADMEHVLMGDGKEDQIQAIANARTALAEWEGK